MLERLTSSAAVAAACQQIAALFRQHAEWFCATSAGGRLETYALRRDEMHIAVAHERLVLSCWTEKGSRSWRILGWEWNGQMLLLQASRRMGAETPLIELVPRASATAVAAMIRAARQIRCDKLAQLAGAALIETRIERAALSPGTRLGQPGRYARVLLRRKQMRIAVTGSVVASQPGSVDAFLSSALLWYKRTADRLKPPYIEQFWLIASSELVKPLLSRVALFREGLRKIIRVFSVDDDLTTLTETECLERTDLWKKKLVRFPPVPAANICAQTAAIVATAPEAIDVVHSRHGETLRYFGLPFARVRSLLGCERVWFGLDAGRRRLLDDSTRREWENLLHDLRVHRSPFAIDQRHAFYRSAAEAWLESVLRRDITKLDPGLIIAPLHAQFRTARSSKLGIRPVDLLALRQDGRLVVIELKVSEDREHVLQGADYWRRVEAHRRRGHIARAKLFGDLKISDESPLVYLVAPTLRVHPSFQILARCIAGDIEIYRFDINESWRSGVRVMRRLRVN
ncbi:MAG TPA: hypothetical protein VLB87_03050 [Pyrinomonadaceae bacterium]|nr:hypothetical protein [Pyrinomonadaceae bacterium]